MDFIQYIPASISGEYRQLLAAALTMAENAGAIHMKYFRRSGLQQSTKLNDSDVVTIADKEAETCILDLIRRHFPSHGIISEESGREHEDREWSMGNRSVGRHHQFLIGTARFLCLHSLGA